MGQVQPPQVPQGAPAERRGQVHHHRVVVEGSAQVELPQGLVLDSEGLRVDDGQLVVAQIQGAEAAEPGKGLGFDLGNSRVEDTKKNQREFKNIYWC